jgi:cell division protein FtsL
VGVAVLGVLIPIIAVGGFFTWMISLSPVGKAYAEKIRVQSGGMTGESADQMLQAIEDLRQEVTELSERVDFTERMLAKAKEKGLLEPPR